MKYKTILSKKDALITIGCLVFVLLNLAAIGNTGRNKAKEIICLSNMKQWHQLFTAYANDNSGFFPPDYYKNLSKCYWWEALEPYYKDKNMLLCPSAIKVRNVSDSGVPYSTDEGGLPPYCSFLMSNYKISYSFNGWMGPAEGLNLAPLYGKRWANINTLLQPHTIPLIGDSIGYPRKFPQADTSPPAYRNQISTSTIDRFIEFCIDRHGPAKDPYINSAFADGSARNVGLKELWVLNWHRTWQQEHQENPITWPQWMQDFTDYE